MNEKADLHKPNHLIANKYYEGNPCKYCGASHRYKKTRNCVPCHQRRALVRAAKRTKEERAESYHRNRGAWIGDRFLMDSIKRSMNIGTAPQNKEEFKDLAMMIEMVKIANGTKGKAKYTLDHIFPITPTHIDGRLIAGRTNCDNLRIMSIKANQQKSNTLPASYTENQVYEPQEKHEITKNNVSTIREKIKMEYGYRTTSNFSKTVLEMDAEDQHTDFIHHEPLPEIRVTMESIRHQLWRWKYKSKNNISHAAIRKLERAQGLMSAHGKNQHEAPFVRWWYEWQENPNGIDECTCIEARQRAITQDQHDSMIELFGVADGSIVVPNDVFEMLPRSMAYHRWL